MTTLIILAHPGSKSFNAQWASASANACSDKVLWSDLYTMAFDPVERAEHYGKNCDSFDPLKAQYETSCCGLLPEDVANEVKKLRAADRIIIHFPLWWFGPPAILKGWIDRCLVHGLIHSSDARFDSGLCKGKEALFCVTTGASAIESGPDGKEGNTHMYLWPLAYSLRYCGFEVKQPVLFHGVHGYFEGDLKKQLAQNCKAILEKQKDLIANWSERPFIKFNADSDFDNDGRLRSSSPKLTPFIK